MSSLRRRRDDASSRLASDVSDMDQRKKSRARWLPYVAGGYVAVFVAYLFVRSPDSPKLSQSSTYALCSRDGARIYTVDTSQPLVECMLVIGSYFADVGTLDSIQKRWNHSSPHENLHIRFIEPAAIVIPGLSDSHVHALEYGASRQILLEQAKSPQDAVKLVHEYITSNKDVLEDKTKFIQGWGWDHTSWPGGRWGTVAAFEADPVTQGRPVALEGKDGHILWVSQKVLDNMGPLPDHVEGGEIVRDSAGKATGVFIDNAQDLVKRPPLMEDDLLRLFTTTVNVALSRGVTAMHDAALDPASLQFFIRQSKKQPLPVRIYGMTYFNESEDYWGNTRTKIVDDGTTRLTARSIKIYADGALRTGGAALYDTYADNRHMHGFMRVSAHVLADIVPRLIKDGWQVNIHGIGDRANALVLDAFEAALNDTNVDVVRPRLEHAQIMTDADMQRMAKLGIIASIQPSHAISDMWYAEDRLGPERIKMLYAFRSMIDHGSRITLGSDCPVEDLHPLLGFYAAITRLSPNGESPQGHKGWFPEQRLTREEALKGMTLDPAYASFTENILGSITPGKRADYVVLNQNIMTIPADKILNTTVTATVIDGSTVYGQI